MFSGDSCHDVLCGIEEAVMCLSFIIVGEALHLSTRCECWDRSLISPFSDQGPSELVTVCQKLLLIFPVLFLPHQHWNFSNGFSMFIKKLHRVSFLAYDYNNQIDMISSLCFSLCAGDETQSLSYTTEDAGNLGNPEHISFLLRLFIARL